MTAQLEPCPADCGEQPYVQKIIGPWLRVFCPCGWEGPECTTKAEAAEAWNKRGLDSTKEN